MQEDVRSSIVASLRKIVEEHPFLTPRYDPVHSNPWFISYSYKKNNTKKVLFWINFYPKKNFVSFVCDNYNNGVVEQYPILLSMADQKTKNIMKIHIFSPQDIQKKGIEELVKLYTQVIAEKIKKG